MKNILLKYEIGGKNVWRWKYDFMIYDTGQRVRI